MPPMGSPHATTLTLALQELQRLFAEGYVVRSQMPLRLNDDSEPEPDIAVVPGTPSDYAAAHPSTALLAVEIAVTTLATNAAIFMSHSERAASRRIACE